MAETAVRERFAAVVGEWLAGNARELPYLSRISGVNYRTLRRIAAPVEHFRRDPRPDEIEAVFKAAGIYVPVEMILGETNGGTDVTNERAVDARTGV